MGGFSGVRKSCGGFGGKITYVYDVRRLGIYVSYGRFTCILLSCGCGYANNVAQRVVVDRAY